MADEKISIKIPDMNKWAALSVILFIALVVSLVFKFGASPTGMVAGKYVDADAGGEMTKEEVADAAVEYINTNLLQGATATLLEVTETESGVYKIKLDIGGQTFDSYVTADGKLLFPSAVDLTVQPVQPQKPQKPQEMTKSDKPEVELFVMSFCPFGIQAENAMKPVVDLLGEKIDIKVRFITQVQGDNLDSIRSLHGPNEAMEDVRQACIQKHFGTEIFWKYLMHVNEKCYPVYRDSAALDKCWREAASTAGIDAEIVETCVNEEGVGLMKEDEQAGNRYGVRGSPTLIINGQRYSGARSSEAFKQAICSAFVEAPEVCDEQTLSTTEAVASGGCG